MIITRMDRCRRVGVSLLLLSTSCSESNTNSGSEETQSTVTVEQSTVIARLSAEIDGLSGLPVLGRTIDLLEVNGYATNWLKEKLFDLVYLTDHPSSVAISVNNENGFEVCISSECQTVELLDDDASLVVDGGSVRDADVVAPLGVEAFGWCSAESATLYGRATDEARLNLAGAAKLEVVALATGGVAFRYTDVDLGTLQVDSGWEAQCPM